MKTVTAFFSGLVAFLSEMIALFKILRAVADQDQPVKSAQPNEEVERRWQDGDPLSQKQKQSI
jgi:hypothetical protein